jgi:methionyl-tRNA formyltransferase
MIFFSSDQDFEIFYKSFLDQGLKIDLLVTESPKKQGRKMQIRANPAHQFAEGKVEIMAFERLDEKATKEIKKYIGEDKLGFIFAYGKLIPENIINLFENGILNIHFSLLPEYPGASPIQQAILDKKNKSGYTVFEITKFLDRGKLLFQEPIKISDDDSFDSLRSRIIERASKDLPKIIKRYLNWEIALTDMPKSEQPFTKRISKSQGEISSKDSAISAYNKYRAFSRWPKIYMMIEGKRFIINEAKLTNNKFEIIKIQPEGKNPMSFNEFKNGHQTLLTKIPEFVKLS